MRKKFVIYTNKVVINLLYKFCHKAFNSWQNFGTRMLMSKAWEKFVVDKYRFRSNIKRTIPKFNYYETNNDLARLNYKNKQKNLTICYFVHYFFPDKQGGTERFVLNLAKYQKEKGHNVRVITLGKRPRNAYNNKTGDIIWQESEFDGIPITQIRYIHAPRGLYYDVIKLDDQGMLEYAKEVIDRYKPDVCHIAYPQPFTTLADVFIKNKIPVVFTLTDFNMICHYATLVCKTGEFCGNSECGRKCQTMCKTYGVKDTQLRYKTASKILNSVNYITVPSQFVANVFGNEFNGIRIQIIPHGIPKQFTNNTTRRKTSKFIYVGTLSALKGVETLIKAFMDIKDNDISLDIYGGGDSTYIEYLKKISNNKNISFRGEVSADKMHTIYQNADCVIVPSIWFETYNFVLREALACGCLGIASDIGAMSEVILDGQNGFLFEPANVVSLKNTILKAKDFDWNKYYQRVFPSISDEGEKYEDIYYKLYDNCSEC